MDPRSLKRIASMFLALPVFVMGNARHVEYDFVKLLLNALRARGLRYDVIAEETGFDAEFPGFLSESARILSDIRLTDREVILARTDLEL
jgi:hypothetical protein